MTLATLAFEHGACAVAKRFPVALLERWFGGAISTCDPGDEQHQYGQ